MPEQAPWRFQKLIKAMVDIPQEHLVLGGLVLTCKGTEAIPAGFIEFEDGRISAVGSVDELGARVSELVDTGGTLLPGLFNSHAHLAWDGVHDLARQSLDDSPEISAYKSAGNMLVSLRSGVTTVRDLGMNQANIHAKQAVEQRIFPGPRLLITGEAIVQTGGHTYWCCREASGPDEMRRAVRDQVRAGADLIKIMACHDTLEFTDEELKAVVDESHRNGLPITAHATYNDAIFRVAQFGIDVIEHGGSMTSETIKLLVEKKIPIVTTFAPVLMQSQPEIARKFDIPEWKIEERQRTVSDKSRYQGLVDAAEAGVAIVFGTDAGSPVVGHDIIAPEMEFMVNLGVVADNYGALRSATCMAAQLSGLEQELGTLTVGHRADVIVVDGDPRIDIQAMGRVQQTYRDGMRLA